MRLVVRLVIALISALLGLGIAPAAMAAPSTDIGNTPGYADKRLCHSGVGHAHVSERGPPGTTHGYTARPLAGDVSSFGPSLSDRLL